MLYAGQSTIKNLIDRCQLSFVYQSQQTISPESQNVEEQSGSIKSINPFMSFLNNLLGIFDKENNVLMSPLEITGKWEAVSESLGGEEPISILEEYEEHSLVLYEDGSYIWTSWGFSEEGKYLIEGDEILFYQDEEDLQYEGVFLEGSIEVNGNSMTLSLPIYPMEVVYQRA